MRKDKSMVSVQKEFIIIRTHNKYVQNVYSNKSICKYIKVERHPGVALVNSSAWGRDQAESVGVHKTVM